MDELAKYGKRKGEAKRDIAEAKEILAEELKGQTLTIVREWKKPERTSRGRHTTRVPPMERADMMKTLIERPDIKTKEFAQKYGYNVTDGKPSQASYAMMDILKEEIQGYKLPEMEEILRADLIVVAHGVKELLRRLKDEPDNLSTAELSLAIDKSFKRSRLLQGKSTSNVAVNVDVNGMNENELDAFLNDAVRVKVSAPEKE